MNECPRCSGAVAEGQEYCLECGAGFPGPAARTDRATSGRAGSSGRGLALVIAFVGATAAIAATDGSAGSVEVRHRDRRVRHRADNGDGHHAVERRPAPDGRVAAGRRRLDDLARIAPADRGPPPGRGTRADARQAGLRAVGILDSSQYASLHPGYWIVFTGVYGSAAEATSALPPARRFARTATVRRVVP